MGMRYFGLLTGLQLNIDTPKPYTEVRQSTSKMFLMPTAKDVTLAEYHPASSDAITAHRLSDYRRRRFSLVLLPNVHIMIEDLLSTEMSTDVSL